MPVELMGRSNFTAYSGSGRSKLGIPFKGYKLILWIKQLLLVYYRLRLHYYRPGMAESSKNVFRQPSYKIVDKNTKLRLVDALNNSTISKSNLSYKINFLTPIIVEIVKIATQMLKDISLEADELTGELLGGPKEKIFKRKLWNKLELFWIVISIKPFLYKEFWGHFQG